MSLPLGSVYAFSVLLAPLEHVLHASRSELASVFGISAVFFTVGANLAPPLFGRIRAPLLVALTAALSGAGVTLAAVAPSLSWLILGYGLLFATGGGMAFVVVQQCVNAGSPTRPGLVNGYLVSLFPLGAMLAAPAFGLGIDWVGVRQTLAGLAAVIGVMGLAAALLVAHAGVVLARSGGPSVAQGVGPARWSAGDLLEALCDLLSGSVGRPHGSQSSGRDGCGLWRGQIARATGHHWHYRGHRGGAFCWVVGSSTDCRCRLSPHPRRPSRFLLRSR
jgi:MFS transporter, OFA family, oxalate/formate antiporter